MAFEDDNTSLIRMKRDFDQFIQGHNDSRVSAFNIERIDTTREIPGSQDTGLVSVKSLLEKEKMFKLKERDYLATKGQLAHLQTKVTGMETSHKRAKLDHDREIEIIKSERVQETQKMCDLLSKLKFMEEKEARAQESLTECQEEVRGQRQKYEGKILALQKEKLQMTEDLEQEKKSTWDKIKELEKEQMRKDSELKICQYELEKTTAQLQLQLKRSSDITNQMKEFEECKLKATQAEQKVKELELKISRMEEDHVIAKGLKTQLSTFQEMEKENRKLKDDNQYLSDIQENNLLLKEQHISMKRKLERMEEKMADYNRVSLENEELKVRLERWEGADKSGPKIRSPSELSKRVGDLQSSEAIMLQKQGELQTNLTLKENTVKNLQDQVASLRNHVQLERSKYKQQTDLLKRMQRKLLLITTERDGYKHTLDMYEKEVTVSLPQGSGSSQDRIQQLEGTVEGYRKQTEYLEEEFKKLEKELLAAKQNNKKLQQKVVENEHSVQNGGPGLQSDQQTILHLREKIADLEKRLEKCEEEKFTLEARIEQRHLQGDYDPTKLKVLHFKMNPVDMAVGGQRSELDKLKEENERLKQRVKMLEENGGNIEDLTVAVEKRLQEPGSSKDIEEMRGQLCSAELKNQRLMEAFKIASKEMREVCYQLTGYKLDLHVPSRNQHRLTSMFAESPNDYLRFQQSEEGEIQMLGTDFSSTVHDLVEMYLTQRDSIPAFLSSVTLELFSRQTMNFG